MLDALWNAAQAARCVYEGRAEQRAERAARRLARVRARATREVLHV